MRTARAGACVPMAMRWHCVGDAVAIQWRCGGTEYKDSHDDQILHTLVAADGPIAPPHYLTLAGFDMHLGGVLSGWEQYFGRLAVGVESLGGGDNGGGDNGRGSYKLVDSRVLELDCAAAWENFHSAPCIYCGSQKKALPARTLRAEQMKKWVHIRPAVSALADQVGGW